MPCIQVPLNGNSFGIGVPSGSFIFTRNPNKGEYVWISNSGARREGNVPRTRGIALWEDLVIANLPDGRVIAIATAARSSGASALIPYVEVRARPSCLSSKFNRALVLCRNPRRSRGRSHCG